MGVNGKSISILVVEDDFLVGVDVQNMLAELGFCEVRLAHDLPKAKELLDAHLPDLAILDVNIGNTLVFPLAAELAARNVPFVFSTGRAQSEFPTEWKSHRILPKPLQKSMIAAAIAALGFSAAGDSSLP